MNKTASPTLPKIFSDILSNMAFIFIANADEEEAQSANYTLQTRIFYFGACKGVLQLRCDGRFAALLAGNLLGVDAADSSAEQKRLDALKELMNVVCGNLVTALYGTEALFDLSIPVVVPLLAGEPVESLPGAEVYTFIAENHVIELTHQVQ